MFKTLTQDNIIKLSQVLSPPERTFLINLLVQRATDHWKDIKRLQRRTDIVDVFIESPVFPVLLLRIEATINAARFLDIDLTRMSYCTHEADEELPKLIAELERRRPAFVRERRALLAATGSTKKDLDTTKKL